MNVISKFFVGVYNTGKTVVYDLLTEKQNGDARKISIGRTAFIVVLFASLNIWTMVPITDIPPNMFLTLGALLGYVLGTKAVSSWTALGVLKANGNGATAHESDKKDKLPTVDGDEGD